MNTQGGQCVPSWGVGAEGTGLYIESYNSSGAVKVSNLTFDSNDISNNSRFAMRLGGSAGLSFVNNSIVGNGVLHVGWDTSGALEWNNNTVPAGSSVPTGQSFSSQKPVAKFSYVQNGNSVTFTNTSSDPDGSIAHVLWDFGDGIPVNTTSPTYTYPAAATYKVTLSVWDNSGRGAIKEVQLNLGADTSAPASPQGLVAH